jgi:L-threonylcarbamoyladenylate synthase
MERKSFDCDDFENALKCLQEGKVILYPTDTIWGLGCDATNDMAIEKIMQLKNRPDSKGMIVLIPDSSWLFRYVTAVPEIAWQLIENAVNPLTIVYPNALNISKKILSDDGSIGIRIVNEPFCQQLLKKFNRPLVSTSANISGEKSPAFFSEINPALIEKVDYTVKWRQEDNSPSKASEIIKVGLNSEITIIRGA